MPADAFENLLEACLSRAGRTLKAPAMLVAIVRSKTSFRVRMSSSDMTRAEVQAVALDLLRELRADIGDGDGCPSCQARVAHLNVAIAALDPLAPHETQTVN